MPTSFAIQNQKDRLGQAELLGTEICSVTEKYMEFINISPVFLAIFLVILIKSVLINKLWIRIPLILFIYLSNIIKFFSYFSGTTDINFDLIIWKVMDFFAENKRYKVLSRLRTEYYLLAFLLKVVKVIWISRISYIRVRF